LLLSAAGQAVRYGALGDRRAAQVGRNHGACRPAADNIALPREHCVGSVNGPAGGREFFGEATRGRQAVTGLKLADPDRCSEVIIDLTIKRCAGAPHQNDGAFPG